MRTLMITALSVILLAVRPTAALTSGHNIHRALAGLKALHVQVSRDVGTGVDERAATSAVKKQLRTFGIEARDTETVELYIRVRTVRFPQCPDVLHVSVHVALSDPVALTRAGQARSDTVFATTWTADDEFFA